MSKILLVDDEDEFRRSLAGRLKLRGYQVLDCDNGVEAIAIARHDMDVEVVVLDLKMPGLSGDQVLKEIKTFRPAVQIILLTGFGSLQSAMELGREDAFAYLEKPCRLEVLIQTIESARTEKTHAMARHEIPAIFKGFSWNWLLGSHNNRPGVIILGTLILVAAILLPPPARLTQLLGTPKSETEAAGVARAYPGYSSMKVGETIAEFYGRYYKLGQTTYDEQGKKKVLPFSKEEASFRAQVMLATLIVAALFWATGAVPTGVTALVVGVSMYFLNVLPPDEVATAYAKDAVIFIFGVLAVSQAVSKTGLDRRIGLLLLGPITSLNRLLFIFLPTFAVACSFVSEHALIAFVMPLFMMVYASSIRAARIPQDRSLAVLFALSLCYVGNSGGPGSPAAGGRNAVMLGILSDYDLAPSFGQWVIYGLPFVPVMALVCGLYFYVAFRKRLKVKNLNISTIVRQSAEQIGPMHSKEYRTAFALIVLVLMWITVSDRFGMGGPVLLCIVLLNIFRILRWRDIAGIPWDVVFLYASAAALGKGLAVTGAALYLADAFVAALPSFLQQGEGLAIATSLFTGLTTNFMSDGATVSAIGPITVPMAAISNTHPWMIGLATAFASSFAHLLIIGTPNNAIAYALAKDPLTGEQLVTLGDFLRHGSVVLVLSFLVLWIWVFFGYWRIIGF
ncbi:MAG: anion permease [Acidobacteriota bacterium]|nr:MAG: anion permease [Acidobacteriota bacterium]